jgi:DNA-directed RNA polymerase subunit L
MNKIKEMYIVKYNFGHSLDNDAAILFVTKSEKTAKNYCKKFNKLLKKWQTYYNQFEKNDWIEDEHQNKFERWYQLRMIDKCYYGKIKLI